MKVKHLIAALSDPLVDPEAEVSLYLEGEVGGYDTCIQYLQRHEDGSVSIEADHENPEMTGVRAIECETTHGMAASDPRGWHADRGKRR